MSQRRVNETSLTATADALRAKLGTSDPIPWVENEGFKAAVESIQTGGGEGGELQELDVTPSHEAQEFIPAEGVAGYNKVTVKPVPRVPVAAVSVESEDAYFEYSVIPVDGSTYGFSLNDSGYYESQNKGIDNSFAMCKVVFHSNYPKKATLNCINYAEDGYDYGLISTIDTMLELNSTGDTSGVHKSFKSTSGTTSETAVSITVPAGDHFVCIKFIKDRSTSQNNDSLQFTVAY